MAEASVIEASVIEASVTTVTECRAVGNEVVMVEVHIMAVPVGSPVVPPPAKSAKKPNPDSCAEENPRLAIKTDPVWVERKRCAIDVPRIVFRHVHHLRACRLDHDSLPLGRHGLLRRALQVARLLRFLTHLLNRVEDSRFVIAVELTERCRPPEVLIHPFKR